MQGSALAWSLLHAQPKEHGHLTTRLERSWHGSVLLLFDHFLEAREARQASPRHGRSGTPAVSVGRVRVLPYADGLAAGHLVCDAAAARARHLRPQQVPVRQAAQGRQAQALPQAPPQPRRSEAPTTPPPRRQGGQQERQGGHHGVPQHTVQVLLDVDGNHVLSGIDARIEQSTVAGRLGLPALSANARLEGVDAVAAGVVAAGPLAGAALSLVLEAVLAVLPLRLPRGFGRGLGIPTT